MPQSHLLPSATWLKGGTTCSPSPGSHGVGRVEEGLLDSFPSLLSVSGGWRPTEAQPHKN